MADEKFSAADLDAGEFGDEAHAGDLLSANDNLLGDIAQAEGLTEFVEYTPEPEKAAEANPPPEPETPAPEADDAPEPEKQARVEDEKEEEVPPENDDPEKEVPPEGDPDPEATTEDKANREALTPEQQHIFDHRIGKLVKQRETALEEKQQLEAQNEQLREQADESRSTSLISMAREVGLDPAYLAKSEADLDKLDAYLAERIQFANQNHDGVEESEDGKTPALDAAAIREIKTRAEGARYRVLPEARKVLHKRQEEDEKARVHYPELFDDKSSAYQVMQHALVTIPGLYMRPNAKMIIGDMLLGAVMRTERQKQTKKSAPPKKPPVIPSKAGAKPGNRLEAPGRRTGNKIDVGAFVAAGAGDDALTEACAQAMDSF